VFDHMGLLSKSSVAHLTHEWLLASVDFKMLLEIKSLRVNQQPTDGAALIVGPVIVHVDVEVV